MDFKNNVEETITKLLKSKKKTAITLVIIIFCLTGVSTFFGFIYIDLYGKHEQLTSDYNKLEGEYTELTNDYAELMGEYIELNEDYNQLEDDFDNLTLEYNDLVDDYDTLVSNYNSLFGAYQSVLSVLENPLTDPDIPTIGEVQSWLSTDDTDKHNYTDVWMCGDFAAMLMVRGKEKNWRIRIACMFWSYNGDSGWENPTDPYGEYGHAFNLIYCQDGNDAGTELDIYYIEPQTDKVWYVVIGTVQHTHYMIWLTFTGGITGTVWQEPYYINHYGYFA